jgi:putative thioredoxin
MAGDTAGAREAYQRLFDRPGVTLELRAEARSGIARASLLERAPGLDPAALQARQLADPADVDAACGVADLLVLSEQAEDAFELLIAVVRATTGDDRDRARTHLLGLFDLFGNDEPAVARARRDLASALF